MEAWLSESCYVAIYHLHPQSILQATRSTFLHVLSISGNSIRLQNTEYRIGQAMRRPTASIHTRLTSKKSLLPFDLPVMQRFSFSWGWRTTNTTHHLHLPVIHPVDLAPRSSNRTTLLMCLSWSDHWEGDATPMLSLIVRLEHRLMSGVRHMRQVMCFLLGISYIYISQDT